MALQDRAVRLLPAHSLVRTGEVDRADWNFRPLLGWIQRIRFKLIARMLTGMYVPRLLEVGYGSGIFMPELSRHCRELYGIDPHRMTESVSRVLAQYGVDATLSSHGAESMPFEDGFFECVVAVSVVEFVGDIEKACSEIERVLTQDGVFLVVTPGNSRIVDAGLRVLTGSVAAAEYGNRRDTIIDTLTARFEVHEMLVSHLPGMVSARLYTALKLRPRR